MTVVKSALVWYGPGEGKPCALAVGSLPSLGMSWNACTPACMHVAYQQLLIMACILSFSSSFQVA